MPDKNTPKNIPIRDGLFTLPSRPGEHPSILGSRCTQCDHIDFPPRAVCPECLHEDMVKTPLSRRGTLYTYSMINYPAPGLTAPYAVGYIDLPEGIRVFSMLTGWGKAGLAVGMDVEMIIEKFMEDEQGNTLLTNKFRPIE